MLEKKEGETTEQFVDRIFAATSNIKPKPLGRELTPLEKRWAADNEDIAETGKL